MVYVTVNSCTCCSLGRIATGPSTSRWQQRSKIQCKANNPTPAAPERLRTVSLGERTIPPVGAGVGRRSGTIRGATAGAVLGTSTFSFGVGASFGCDVGGIG